jgi:hypothetical protein
MTELLESDLTPSVMDGVKTKIKLGGITLNNQLG